MVKPKRLQAEEFAPALEDLGIELGSVQVVDPVPPPPSSGLPPESLEPGHPLLIGQIGAGVDVAGFCARLRARTQAVLPVDAPAMFFLKDLRPDRELAAWRNALWPWLHVVCVYRVDGGVAERETLQGRRRIAGTCAADGVLLVGRRRDHVLSPQATVEKFDQNAPAWNGEPGGRGYAHFRWMRRYVGLFGEPRADQRLLDFGCGAGWVGIEAALAAGGAPLRAFDPSPEMVRIATENARAAGLQDFEARAGFGEAPPWPAADEPPFDHVISSGVVSFSPDVEAWIAGLAGTVALGGRLVVGDINPESRGMRKRRASKVLLPAREMNGRTAREIRERLERLGFRHRRTAGYQLTSPVPEAMHFSDTRLGGLLTPLLLAANRARAGSGALAGFDSWVMSFDAPA